MKTLIFLIVCLSFTTVFALKLGQLENQSLEAVRSCMNETQPASKARCSGKLLSPRFSNSIKSQYQLILQDISSLDDLKICTATQAQMIIDDSYDAFFLCFAGKSRSTKKGQKGSFVLKKDKALKKYFLHRVKIL